MYIPVYHKEVIVTVMKFRGHVNFFTGKKHVILYTMYVCTRYVFCFIGMVGGDRSGLCRSTQAVQQS